MANDNRLVQYLYNYPVLSINRDIANTETNFTLGEDLCRRTENIGKKILALGIQGAKGTDFTINDTQGYIGDSQVFELDNVMNIFSFTVGTPRTKYPQGILITILFES